MAKSVLLVEDDFFIRELYQRTLEGKGFQVLTAVDGEEAIDLYAENHVDIVLLDIMLPNLSGMDVLRHIRSMAKSNDTPIPVIMITNLNTPESMDEALSLGADEYWVKADKTPADIADGINHYLIQ